MTKTTTPIACDGTVRLRVGWKHIAALVGLVAYALAFQGARPLWEPDEGRYTAVAVEMLHTGEWRDPHLNLEVVHFTKPPLTYWAIASSLAVFGRTEIAARLPNTIAFVFTVLLLVGIARRLGLNRPWLAGLIYATSLLPFVAANTVTTDTLLALWLTLAGWGFVAAWTSVDTRSRRVSLLTMWLGFGLAFLTKGPVSLLPLAAFVLFSGLTGGRESVRGLFNAPGLVIFAAVGMGWFVEAVLAHPHLLGYFLGYEVLDRVVSGTHGRHGEWYGAAAVYLPTLVVGAMPWLPLGFPGWDRLRDLVRRRSWARWIDADRPLVFLLLWFLSPLLVFSMARSRLPLYLLPCFAPLTLLLARRLGRTFRFTPPRVAGVGLWIAVLLALRMTAGAVKPDKTTAQIARQIAARVGESIEEVVIVEGKAGFAYGFTFYLDCDVEHVALNPEGVVASLGRVTTLAGEVGEPAENRVFAVPNRWVASFVHEIEPTGLRYEHIGEWNSMQLYWCPRPNRRVAMIVDRDSRYLP